MLYGLAGYSGFFLDSLFAILAGCALLGFAVAGVMVSATTLITDYYVGQARANFMGLQAGFMGLGGVVFLSAGGAMAEANWRYPFLIYLFAWVILPLILLSIYEPQRNASNTLQSVNLENKNSDTSRNLLIGVCCDNYVVHLFSYPAITVINTDENSMRGGGAYKGRYFGFGHFLSISAHAQILKQRNFVK